MMCLTRVAIFRARPNGRTVFLHYTLKQLLCSIVLVAWNRGYSFLFMRVCTAIWIFVIIVTN